MLEDFCNILARSRRSFATALAMKSELAEHAVRQKENTHLTKTRKRLDKKYAKT